MHIASLYRYPVKGLTPEPLERTSLVAGETLPFDRAWAIENGQGRFDPAAPRHLPKINFLMLMRDERLATLRTQFDDATETLTILRDGKQVARGQLTTPLGRQLIEQFVGAYMKAELRGPPKIVHAPGHSFSDVAAKCVHVVNLASVRELERTLGRPVDPLRFRANVYLEGVEPLGRVRLDGQGGRDRRGQALRVRAHDAVRGDQRRSGQRRARHGGAGPPAAHLGPSGLRHLRQGRDRRRDQHRRAGGPAGVADGYRLSAWPCRRTPS